VESLIRSLLVVAPQENVLQGLTQKVVLINDQTTICELIYLEIRRARRNLFECDTVYVEIESDLELACCDEIMDWTGQEPVSRLFNCSETPESPGVRSRTDYWSIQWLK
jgi:hypothetical protein